MDDRGYLNHQVITYLGNKRKLLPMIGQALDEIEKTTEIKLVGDLFAGSGVVGRYMKFRGYNTISNDFEPYSKLVNEAYLANMSELPPEVWDKYITELESIPLREGFITKLYAPVDDDNIQPGERVFYTHHNGMVLDTLRPAITEIVPQEYQKFFLASLLYKAGVNTNQAGQFRAFYKDKNTGIGKFGGTKAQGLDRIKKPIVLEKPILCEQNTDYLVFTHDTNTLIKETNIPFDVVYIDSPYNEHSYGANYHMLNTILSYEEPQNITKVAGCPSDWQRSAYYKKAQCYNAMEDLVKNVNSKWLLISFSDEGHISFDEMVDMLEKYGEVHYFSKEHPIFGGCRNYERRMNKKGKTVEEFLYILHKE